MTKVDELSELCEAYHTVVVELRHILALHSRMRMIMDAAKQDIHKLETAVHRVQDLEREVTHRVGEPT